jgi:NAD-dependent dihydropyrimidine dehydrogenase PreA subunit
MKMRGNARLVEREEFLGLLDRAEKKGFVLQGRNIRNPDFICCCCGDCCEILQTAKKLPRPVEAFHTNFFARVDEDLCTGCGRCVARCQMDAITLADSREKQIAVIYLDRCIGCGLCVPTCPAKSITLEHTKKEVVPPRNRSSMYMKMYRERRGVLGAAAVALKYVLGKKI